METPRRVLTAIASAPVAALRFEKRRGAILSAVVRVVLIAIVGLATAGVPTPAGATKPRVLTGGEAVIDSISAFAATGSPANPNVPSANPGQTITVQGAGLSSTTFVVMRYTDSQGAFQTTLVTLDSASGDGSSATLTVPMFVNGVYLVTPLPNAGPSPGATLQIVPIITGVISTPPMVLFGAGFQEGSTQNPVSYNAVGSSVADLSANNGPEINSNSDGVQNSIAILPASFVPLFPGGGITVTTSGGTSAQFALP